MSPKAKSKHLVSTESSLKLSQTTPRSNPRETTILNSKNLEIQQEGTSHPKEGTI
jgi:hypothetical protein